MAEFFQQILSELLIKIRWVLAEAVGDEDADFGRHKLEKLDINKYMELFEQASSGFGSMNKVVKYNFVSGELTILAW